MRAKLLLYFHTSLCKIHNSDTALQRAVLRGLRYKYFDLGIHKK